MKVAILQADLYMEEQQQMVRTIFMSCRVCGNGERDEEKGRNDVISVRDRCSSSPVQEGEEIASTAEGGLRRGRGRIDFRDERVRVTERALSSFCTLSRYGK